MVDKHLIVFDLDDTLILWSQKLEIQEQIFPLLKDLYFNGHTLAIISHNPYAANICSANNISQYFTKIIGTSEAISKAKTLEKLIIDLSWQDKSKIIFYDDDKYNIRQILDFGVLAILVNPIRGILDDNLLNILSIP